MSEIYYVYRYYDPSRGEYIYIGKGKDKRAWSHLCFYNPKKMHPFKQRLAYMKRHGVEPIIDFICQDVDEEFAYFVEIEAIAKYGRKDLGRGPLLNLTDGGPYMINRSPESKARSGFRGKHTDATKAVLSTKVTAHFAIPGMKEAHSAIGKLAMTDEVCLKISERTKAAMAAGASAKSAATQCKPCTIDGITIYPSMISLKAALGQGKNGTRSTKFRYI